MPDRPSPDAPSGSEPASPYALDAERGEAAAEVLRLSGRRVLFDGVFKGDYSLAVVNRNLARALMKNGVELTLFCPEEALDQEPLLSEMPDVKARLSATRPEPGVFDIHLRNTWPPGTDGMVGKFNAYVCYAWEELEYPPEHVDAFNAHLDLVMVTSDFVRLSLLHSGVTVPIAVVGNGTDHLDAEFGRLPPREGARDRALFLHVSSCFPRKGADVLAEAFAKGFLASEPVELLIKTFPNPHSRIEGIVETLRRRFPHAAPIRIVDRTLSSREMAELYRDAAALVAPSRGEGFGLPLAEAMLAGAPVITTATGGPSDFCTPETAWLLDYRLVRSEAHVAGDVGLWAEPDAASLIEAMRRVLAEPESVARRTRNAEALLRAHFKWSDVARRVALALDRTLSRRVAAVAKAPFSIDLVSTWSQSCGVATYSEHLFGTPVLRPELNRVFARRLGDDAIPDRPSEIPAPKAVARPWGDGHAGVIRLAGALKKGGADVLWLQHHPGFFSYDDMLVLSEAVRASPYPIRAVTLHNLLESNPDLAWLDAFDIAFVHTPGDAEVLSRAGYHRAAVIPHGILETEDEPRRNGGAFTVGTFGFLYPHKAIVELVDAIDRARTVLPQIRLKLFTCAQRSEKSRLERARVEALIDLCGLRDHVETHFDFLPDAVVIEGLRSCDLLCFPYGASKESTSGAVRTAMSADRPILCSKSPIFKDLAPYAHVLSDTSPAKIAEAILVLAGHEDLRAMHDEERRRYVARNSFQRAAQRYNAHFEYLRERA